jgi:hypothetical protein
LKKKAFEFMAAMIMSGIYQKQWWSQTYIGFYLDQDSARKLELSDARCWELYADVLENVRMTYPVSPSG